MRLLVVAALASAAIGQPAAADSVCFADHLQPVDSGIFQPRDPYLDRIHRLLLDDDDPLRMAAVVTSAFVREWSILIRPTTGDTAKLVMRIPRERLSDESSDRKRATKVTTYEGELSAKTAEAVFDAWKALLRETHYSVPLPPNVECIQVDGTSHEFALYERGFVAAMTGGVASPAPCSRTGQLVELLWLLRRYAVLPRPAKQAEQELEERARVLADAKRSESAIAECQRAEAAALAIPEDTRSIASSLADLGRLQYCACGSWPDSSTDLRFLDQRVTEIENRNTDLKIKSWLPAGFDFDSALRRRAGCAPDLGARL